MQKKAKRCGCGGLVTLTSSRGVAKTGISLSDKDVGMWRFDEFTSVEGRFNPHNQSVEPWRIRMRSGFTQLAGRIANPGKNDKDIPKRVAVVARASKRKQQTQEDQGIFTWVNCLNLLEKIPSIKINEKIIFCSYNAKISMKKEDPTLAVPRVKKLYNDRITEVNPDQLIHAIFNHLGKKIQIKNKSNVQDKIHITNLMSHPNEVSSLLSGSVTNCVDYTIGLV